MKLFRKEQPLPSPRQRYLRSSDERPQAVAYHGRRVDPGSNTGRGVQRTIPRSRSHLLLRLLRQRVGMSLLALVVAICLINSLILSTDPKIVVLTGSSEPVNSSAANTYRQTAHAQLASSIWNHTKLTININQTEQHLRQSFPNVAALSIALPLIAHRPTIFIQPSIPAATLVSNSGQTFLLDTNGRVIANSTQVNTYASLRVPVIQDQSGLLLHDNQTALSPADVRFIGIVTQELAARQDHVSIYSLVAGSRELDAQISNQPYFVKFNLQSDNPQVQAGTFLAAEAKLRASHSLPTKYFDVRVDGRAYYL